MAGRVACLRGVVDVGVGDGRAAALDVPEAPVPGHCPVHGSRLASGAAGWGHPRPQDDGFGIRIAGCHALRSRQIAGW